MPTQFVCSQTLSVSPSVPMPEFHPVTKPRGLNPMLTGRHRSYPLDLLLDPRHLALPLRNTRRGPQRFPTRAELPGYTPTAEVLVQTARCRLRLGSRGAALLAVREALNVDPADEAARTLKRRLTRMEEAEEAYRQARAGGRWRAARTARETCVGLYEEEECVVPVEVRCWSVHLAVAERAWEEAKSAVDKLLAEEPQAIDVLLAKITVLFFAGDIPEALEQAKAALKFDPDNVALKTAWTRIKNVSRHEVRGRAYSLFREYEAELKCWGRALEFVPDRLEDGGGGLLRASLLFNKARAELKLKQYAEGLKSIDASLKLDDLRWKPYLIRGRIQVGLELFDLAVEDFKICLQRALLKASDASTDDIELLESELKRTERLAAKAKTKLKDYYQILGLKPTCTSAEIRRAYRTESLKHHPDKGGIEEKFKLVNEAYSTLSDLDARLMYDAKRARESRRSTYSAESDEEYY
ncbi:uncharacterized protein B0H18DRAFT_64804 [Fomitopsis serialis]|uniref:uncharacterized protein n=1 Tax=Fomitopsis serialis TaxID=139415 RepID=UPI0020087D77|nr:uncharacterized protein B0H18DRAFT_64804 [Neoantrodia serialis]KAH9916530.1 hypothetical protein B0H18DRAFT_64804 [Neoantrodia serialis]